MKTGPVWLDGWCESGPLGQIVAALLLCSLAPLHWPKGRDYSVFVFDFSFPFVFKSSYSHFQGLN